MTVPRWGLTLTTIGDKIGRHTDLHYNFCSEKILCKYCKCAITMKCVDAKRGQRQKTENYKKTNISILKLQIKTKYNCCFQKIFIKN